MSHCFATTRDTCPYAFLFFFLFKQKTAYEMRISDWSSDVCSSDLESRVPSPESKREEESRSRHGVQTFELQESRQWQRKSSATSNCRSRPVRPTRVRSEEHTSELQSLMRISYAVFCLKKKKNIYRNSRYSNNANTYDT